jgi:hypothetical protein
MKILVATALTQGTSPDDYHYGTDGELVWLQEPCDRDKNDPAGPCGCGRDDVVLAFRTSLADGGWPVEWADEVADENLEIATTLPAWTIIVRKLESYFLRGALLRCPTRSPEQR